MITVPTRVVAVAAAALILLLLPVARGADAPGVLWESTSQMEMDGMPMKMPAQTQKFCAATVWTRPPAASDPNCTVSNFAVVGSRATWNVRCTGQMQMTGLGDMTFNGTDAYTGIIKFTGDGMTMTTRLSGRKIGTCDNPQ